VTKTTTSAAASQNRFEKMEVGEATDQFYPIKISTDSVWSTALTYETEWLTPGGWGSVSHLFTYHPESSAILHADNSDTLNENVEADLQHLYTNVAPYLYQALV